MIDRLLQLIAKHDGEWGWYQLDRAVDVRTLPPGESLIDILQRMEADGLVEVVRVPDRPQGLYRITEQGRLRLSGAVR